MNDEEDDIEEVEGAVISHHSSTRISPSRSALRLVTDYKEPACSARTSDERLSSLGTPSSWPLVDHSRPHSFLAGSSLSASPTTGSDTAKERPNCSSKQHSPTTTATSVAGHCLSPPPFFTTSHCSASSAPACSSRPAGERVSNKFQTRSRSRSPSVAFDGNAPGLSPHSKEEGAALASPTSLPPCSRTEERSFPSRDQIGPRSMQDESTHIPLSSVKSSSTDTTGNSLDGYTSAAELAARVVTELLEVCVALLKPLSNGEEQGAPSQAASVSSLSFATVALLSKAQGTVFDFWPVTGLPQPRCLDEFCRLVSRQQRALAGSPTSCLTTQSREEEEDEGCFSGSVSSEKGPPFTGQRSSILEPTVDEMDDIFAVLSSPSKSVERKKHPRTVQSIHGSSPCSSSAVGGPEEGRTHAVESPCRPFSCREAPHSTEVDAEVVSLHGSREVLSLVEEDDEGDLDSSLPSAVIPRSFSSASGGQSIGNGFASSSQDEDNLPLRVWRSGKVRNQASSLSACSLDSSNPSKRNDVDEGGDESRSLPLAETDVEDDSIASWARSRRKRERGREDSPSSREVSTTSDANTSDYSTSRHRVYTDEGAPATGKSDPFRVAMQRMQNVFDRLTKGQRKEATVVGGVSSDELVRDLPAHLRRWFSKDFSFSRRIDCINKEVFGHADFRGLQLGAINAVMSGRDCFLVMPTGGGKSLCFQLPAYALGGLTLVVSPLLALMGDQLRSLKNLGVEATKIDGEMPKSELLRVYDELRQDNFSLRILMSTPEFLSRSSAIHDVLQSLYARGQLKLIVVDEAHCVCQWGEDFRSDYLSLGKLKKAYPEVPLLALTASASPDVFDEVKRILRIPNSVDFRMSANRPNLFLEVREKSKQSIYEIVEMLSTPPLQHAAGIIYCLSIKDCETVASHLSTLGINAAPYHAKMQPRKRHQTQASWMEGQVEVIVSTVAFGLGVDRSDVRFVFHHSMPPSVERYYQEIGRAGRDGRASRCVLFYSPTDVQRISKLLVSRPKRGGGGGAKGEKGRLERLEKMVLFCEASVECRRRLLLQAFGEDLRTEDDGPECGREDAKLGGEDDGESSFMALSERAQQESRQMLKGTVCARSCDNCWKKTHLAVQFHDVTEYAQKVMRLLLTQERLCPGGGYGSGLTRKQLCEAVKGCYSRKTALQSKLQQNEHVGCMKSITTKDIETLIRHMIKDQWLVETVVSMKGKFASYAVLRPGSSARTPLLGPRRLIVPNFQQPTRASTASSSLDRARAATIAGADLEKGEPVRSRGSAEWLSGGELADGCKGDETSRASPSCSLEDRKGSQTVSQDMMREVHALADAGEEATAASEDLLASARGEPGGRDPLCRSFARHLLSQKRRKVTVIVPEIEGGETRADISPDEKENVFMEGHSDGSFSRSEGSGGGRCTATKQPSYIGKTQREDKTQGEYWGDTGNADIGEYRERTKGAVGRQESGSVCNLSSRSAMVLLKEYSFSPVTNHDGKSSREEARGSRATQDDGSASQTTASARLARSAPGEAVSEGPRRTDPTFRVSSCVPGNIDKRLGTKTVRSSDEASAAELWRILTDDAEEEDLGSRGVASRASRDTEGSLSPGHSGSKQNPDMAHNHETGPVSSGNIEEERRVTDVVSREELSRQASPPLQRSQFCGKKKTYQTTLTTFLRKPASPVTGSDSPQPASTSSPVQDDDRVTTGRSNAPGGEMARLSLAESRGDTQAETVKGSGSKRRLPPSWFAGTDRR